MIDIFLVGSELFIWDADVVCKLRLEHRICGSLVGSLPRKPWQSTTTSLPLSLSNEETYLLVKRGLARVMRRNAVAMESNHAVTVETFHNERRAFEKQQIRIFSSQQATNRKRFYGMEKKSKKHKKHADPCIERNWEEEDMISSDAVANRQDLNNLNTNASERIPDCANLKWLDELAAVSSSKENLEVEENTFLETDWGKEVEPNNCYHTNDQNVDAGLQKLGTNNLITGVDWVADIDIELRDSTERTMSVDNGSDRVRCDHVSHHIVKDSSSDTSSDINVHEAVDASYKAPILKDNNKSTIVVQQNDLATNTDDSQSSDAHRMQMESSGTEHHGTNQDDQLAEGCEQQNTNLKNSVRIHIPTRCLTNARSISLVDWKFPETDRERDSSAVFQDLWNQGYYITNASKFGADFCVYPGDPLRYHAYFIVLVLARQDELTGFDLLSYGRLGASVKKNVVLASVSDRQLVSYISLSWTPMKTGV